MNLIAFVLTVLLGSSSVFACTEGKAYEFGRIRLTSTGLLIQDWAQNPDARHEEYARKDIQLVIGDRIELDATSYISEKQISQTLDAKLITIRIRKSGLREAVYYVTEKTAGRNPKSLEVTVHTSYFDSEEECGRVTSIPRGK